MHGRISSGLGQNGLMYCDPHESSQLNELKVNNGLLNTISGWHSAGDVIMIEQMPILGGYAGGVEETAICSVASTLASFCILNSDIHLDGPIHIRWGITTARETLQAAAHVACALDYNTDVLLANQYYTMAGPCTEMCLLEIAAQAAADTASGRELISGVAAAKGVMMDKATGMEARMLGEASAATCGMEISEVNRIIDRIVSEYEMNYSNAPAGRRYQDCYQVNDALPSEEYIDLYDSTLDHLSDCGLGF